MISGGMVLSVYDCAVGYMGISRCGFLIFIFCYSDKPDVYQLGVSCHHQSSFSYSLPQFDIS